MSQTIRGTFFFQINHYPPPPPHRVPPHKRSLVGLSGHWNSHCFCFCFFYEIKKNFFLVYFSLRRVFIAARGLSLVVASGGHSSLRCAGLVAVCGLLLLQSTGSRHRASVVAAGRLSSCGLRALERRLSSCGEQA